jgi:hypothetical protein
LSTNPPTLLKITRLYFPFRALLQSVIIKGL